MPSEVMLQRSVNPNLHQVPRASILKPEYMDIMTDSLDHHLLSSYDDNRQNTNTAPVYSADNPGPPKKRSLPKRQTIHPYSRYMQDFSMPDSKGNYHNVDYNRNSPASRVDYALLKSRSTHSLPPRASTNVTTATTATTKQRYFDDSASSKSSTPPRSSNGHSALSISGNGNNNTSNGSNNSGGRSANHGQAEQLRRSRESNTFALIDNQLSKAPLDQIREMYLQVKGISTASGSIPRTTKKANLSAVHTIVRFRIRDYLLDMKDYSRRLLDTVISAQQNSSESLLREYDQLFSSVCTLPCSRDCEHCDRLQFRWDRFRAGAGASHSSGRRVPPMNGGYQHQSSRHSMTYGGSQQKTFSSTSLLHVHNKYKSKTAGGGAMFQLPTTSSVSYSALSQNSSSNLLSSEYDQHSSPLEFPSPGPELHVSSNGQTDSLTLLLNEKIGRQQPQADADSKQASSKRFRYDSTAAKIFNELDMDQIDWSATSIDFGPCGEEPVDLQNLILDATNNTLISHPFNFKGDPDSLEANSLDDNLMHSPTSGVSSDCGTRSDSLLNGNDIAVFN